MKRRKLRRVLIWSAVVFFGVPLLYLLAALGLALIPVNRGFVETPGGIEVFLLSNGVHVDFLVPASTPIRDWSQKLPRKDFRGIDESWSYVLFGWGDRAIYLETPTWADLKLSTAFSAVFLPSPSVVHAQ